jgi:hypothetical protein
MVAAVEGGGRGHQMKEEKVAKCKFYGSVFFMAVF